MMNIELVSLRYNFEVLKAEKLQRESECAELRNQMCSLQNSLSQKGLLIHEKCVRQEEEVNAFYARTGRCSYLILTLPAGKVEATRGSRVSFKFLISEIHMIIL